MDSDNITIYDNDSDEEEWEEEEEEGEEEEEKGMRQAVTRHQVYEGDLMEKSLRSCLSKAKLWGSLDEDKVCAHTHTHTIVSSWEDLLG